MRARGGNANTACEEKEGRGFEAGSRLPTHGEDAHLQPTDAPIPYQINTSYFQDNITAVLYKHVIVALLQCP